MGNGTEACNFVEDVNSSYNPPILIITFILGFIGNVVALWIFSFHVRCWKPNTVYSLNLAIADTLLICCLPFRADYFIRGKNWIFGDVACRLKIFMIFLNRTASVILLTVMAIDRYFKVVHPHHRMNKMPTRCAVKVAGSLWVLAVAISLHFLTECHKFRHNNRTFCEPVHIHDRHSINTIWTDIVFIVFKFAIPSSIILFSTSRIIRKLTQMKTEIRRKYKRAMKLVIAVAAVFVLCFLPTNIAVIAVLITKNISPANCNLNETAVQIFYDTLCITYLNSVFDPVIYYFSSSTFKDSLKKALVALKLRCTELETNPAGQAKGKQSGESSKLSSADNICDQFQTEMIENL
ncbi:hydroxycarboxylic acid receptor 2-like [Chiloscyllium plagiosum]|uniref:hydroxycarboxylic acid receptor 2-like n=1 Tax=Chiloscyllium plagiosum TaxID=36176 RepID=UPI001CB7DAD1|nr:hydroxycarboxylic acid receptor 2-like [Chiloscyllium plagiosum]